MAEVTFNKARPGHPVVIAGSHEVNTQGAPGPQGGLPAAGPRLAARAPGAGPGRRAPLRAAVGACGGRGCVRAMAWALLAVLRRHGSTAVASEAVSGFDVARHAAPLLMQAAPPMTSAARACP